MTCVSSMVHPSRERCVADFNEKEALISHDVLPTRQLKHKLALPYMGANTHDLNSSLFLKFPYCGLFKRFPLLHSPSWGSPVILASKRVPLVNEAEKKDAPCSIQNQQSGRGSAAHYRTLLVRHCIRYWKHWYRPST